MISGAVSEALERLRAGEVVAFPTETFFGLAADPSNERAVREVLALKDRGEGGGIPVILDRADRVDELIAEESSFARDRRLALQDRFWPGPLTLIFGLTLAAKGRLSAGILGPGETLAARVSSADLARELATGLGGIVSATSANLHGAPPPKTASRVREYFPDIFVVEEDLASVSGEAPSTILDLTGDKVGVLREGAIPRSQLLECVDELDR